MSKQDERDLLSPPGNTIRETIYRMDMDRARLAIEMDMPLPEINDLIVGKKTIDEKIAEKLESVLHIDRQFWINREKIYRDKLAKLK